MAGIASPATTPWTTLATRHFWGRNLGLPVTMASLALQAHGLGSTEAAIAVSSIVVLVSLMFFAVNLLLNGGGLARQ